MVMVLMVMVDFDCAKTPKDRNAVSKNENIIVFMAAIF
jgi:hypothetical protein